MPALVLGGVLAGAAGGAEPTPPEDRRIDALVETLRRQGVLDDASAERILSSDDAFQTLVEMLGDKGVLDASEEERLSELPRPEAVEPAGEAGGPSKWQERWRRFEVFGDFRGRFKGVFFDEDPTGYERNNRTRGQTRARLRGKMELNRFFDLQLGVTTVNDRDSARRKNLDWGKPFNGKPGDIALDQAFATIHPTGRKPLPWGLGEAKLVVGEGPPPFLSDVGQDLMVWDPTLSLDGIYAEWRVAPFEELRFRVVPAFYNLEVAEEFPNPRLVAVHNEVIWEPIRNVEWSNAFTLYHYDQLDNENDDFNEQGAKYGNLPMGLTKDDVAVIVDVRSWIRVWPHPDWPVAVYGRYLRNLDAKPNRKYDAGHEDEAWSAGIEIGDPDAWFEVGAGYFWLQANAVPAQYPSFEPFDGRTNREVWKLHLARSLMTDVLFEVEVFLRDVIDNGIDRKQSVIDSRATRVNAGVTLFF